MTEFVSPMGLKSLTSIIGQCDSNLGIDKRMIELDGSGSFDQNNDPLNYNWQIVTKPAIGADTEMTN